MAEKREAAVHFLSAAAEEGPALVEMAYLLSLKRREIGSAKDRDQTSAAASMARKAQNLAKDQEPMAGSWDQQTQTQE